MTYESPPPLPASVAPKVVKPVTGIGGWMILPIIGFVVTIGLTVKNLIDASQYSDALIRQMLNPATALSFKASVFTSLVGGIIVICSAIAALIVVFRKMRIAVTIITVHFIVLFAVSFLDAWGDIVVSDTFHVDRDPSAVTDVIRTFIYTLIWIPYFHLSRRVKNTFVN